MKILIIEDEYKLADAISEILKKEKFTTKIITNGEEGENEALTNIYDLILLDVMLPNKNGFERKNRYTSNNINSKREKSSKTSPKNVKDRKKNLYRLKVEKRFFYLMLSKN